MALSGLKAKADELSH